MYALKLLFAKLPLKRFATSVTTVKVLSFNSQTNSSPNSHPSLDMWVSFGFLLYTAEQAAASTFSKGFVDFV